MTGSASITRRPARARRSCSSTSSPTITAATSRRCAYFGRRYRCIAYNARGYPPSDVPEDAAQYSQDRARDDIRAVLDALAITKAHVVGISMGGFATLHFGLAYPERALSLVVAGCGYGAEPGKRQQFHDETAKTVALIERAGMKARRQGLLAGPVAGAIPEQGSARLGRVCRQSRRAFDHGLGADDARRSGAAPVPVGFDRPDGRLEVPTLIMTGDEDQPCLEPGILMKRTIPTAALVVFPNTGHAVNLEEPRSVQPHLRRFLSPGRERALAAPRPARGHRLDPRCPVTCRARIHSGHRGGIFSRRPGNARRGRRPARRHAGGI